jgi:hypothetical protein
MGQNLNYRFASKKDSCWRQQYSIGGEYRFWLDHFFPCIQGIDFRSRYSQADSRRLSAYSCSDDIRIRRRLRGLWSAGATLGLALKPFNCLHFFGGINYNFSKYQHCFGNGKHSISGFGSTFELTCWLNHATWLKAKSEICSLYNYYEGSLHWPPPCAWQGVTIGICGAYTQGKHKLADSGFACLELTYAFGSDDDCGIIAPTKEDDCYKWDLTDLANWMADLPSYIPEVLAVPEQKIVPLTN